MRICLDILDIRTSTSLYTVNEWTHLAHHHIEVTLRYAMLYLIPDSKFTSTVKAHGTSHTPLMRKSCVQPASFEQHQIITIIIREKLPNMFSLESLLVNVSYGTAMKDQVILTLREDMLDHTHHPKISDNSRQSKLRNFHRPINFNVGTWQKLVPAWKRLFNLFVVDCPVHVVWQGIRWMVLH